MSDKTIECVYCHRPLLPKHHADPDHPYVCDLCMEAIRTHKPINAQPAKVTPSPQSDERKSSRRKGRKTNAVATALVFMLLPLVGCAISWSGRIELELDPTPLLTLQRPLPPAPPAPPVPPLMEP